MNKQELIKKYEHMNHDCFRRVDVSEVLSDLIRLDKPQKPVVPQYIADFITEQKKHGLTLSYSIDASMSDGVAEWYWDNPELFARAWLDGYEVEKEKRYLVKMKGKMVVIGISAIRTRMVLQSTFTPAKSLKMLGSAGCLIVKGLRSRRWKNDR